MIAKFKPFRARPAISVVAVGLLAAGAIVAVGTSGAVADTAPERTFAYHCNFPLLPDEPLNVSIKVNMPTVLQVNTPIPPITITTVDTVNLESAVGMTGILGASTLEGTALAETKLSGPKVGGTISLPIVVDNAITKVTMPNPPVPFDVQTTNTSNIPSIAFRAPGPGQVTIGNLLLTITLRHPDGSLTGVDVFQALCTIDAGQSNVVVDFDVVGGPTATPTITPTPTVTPTPTATPTKIKYGFNLTGSSYIRAANGALPLTGGLDASYDLATSNFTADLALNPTIGNFTVLGFLPVQAGISFVQSGPTTGTLVGGVLKSSSKMTVQLPWVSLFGFAIGGTTGCQTATPVDIPLTSTAALFNPLQGGPLAGTFTMPSLQNCGWFTPFLTMFTAGAGNTVNVNLTPRP